MEVRARYTLIGAFTLAVIAAGFVFVYWLNTGGSLGPRAAYRIRYDGPVAGLMKGSAVLFNGIRVGEVTDLRLDPAAPRDVVVDIAIERQTPLRADTRAGIDFQGLAGAPVVALAGGTPQLPLLSEANAAATGEPPQLIAEKNAGQGVTQAARDVLRQIDTVITDNATPLRNTIANVEKFSEALARNTGKVDGIVAGIERFTGGGAKVPTRIIDLTAAHTFAGLQKRPTVQLLVPEPTALAVLDSEKIGLRGTGTSEAAVSEKWQWPDMLPKVVQARIVQSFENAQYLRVIGRAPDGTKSDFQLVMEIRAFQAALTPGGAAEVEIGARLIDTEGKIADARVFRGRAPSAVDPAAAAKAIGTAFEQVATEIVLWACATI